MRQFWIIVELLATGFENFIILESLGKIFEHKFSGVKKWTFFGICFLAATGYVIFLNQIAVFEGWLSFVTIAIFIIYGFICLKGSIIKKAVMPILLYTSILLINLSITFIFSFLLDISPEKLMSTGNTIRLLTLFITKFMFFIVTRIILHIFRSDTFSLKSFDLIISLLLILSTNSIGIIIVEIQLKNENQNILSLILTICVIAVNIFIFYAFKSISTKNKKELQISMLEIQLSEQKAMIEDAANISKEIKKTEHDLKHHFLSILGLLEDECSDEAKKYIKQLIGNYESNIFKYISIENIAINGILNFKISRCKANNIDIKLSIESDFSVFDELDICVMLSNLLDNAIEASMLVESPKIELSITNNGNYLCVLVRNRIENSVLNENSNLPTTKKDTAAHGFGIYSISQIVEKYDGIKNIYEKAGYFTVDIWLKRKTYNLQERIKEEALYQTRQKRYQTRHFH